MLSYFIDHVMFRIRFAMKKIKINSKCKDTGFTWRWIRQSARVFTAHQSTCVTSIPLDNGGMKYERGPTACVIDNCCTVAACLPSPLWPANSSGIWGRLGWWLMSAPVFHRPRLYASCCSQTARCFQIWLISEVTVQLLNSALDDDIKK